MPPSDRRTTADIRRLVQFLWTFARPHARLLVLTVLFTGAYAAVSALRSFLAGGVVDTILQKREALSETDVAAMWERAKTLAAFATFLAVGLGTSAFFKESTQESFVTRVILTIRERVAAHLLTLSLRFFHRRKMGDLFSRLTSDVGQAQQALGFLFGDIVEDILSLAANLAICIYASPLLSLTALVAGPAVILPIATLGRKVRKRARGRQDAQAEVTESMQQMLSGIRTVKAYHAERREEERFHEQNEDFFRKTLKVIRAKSFAKALLEGINNGLVPFVLLGGIWLVQRGKLTPGDLGTFMTSLVLMYAPARKLARAFNNMQEALAGVDRLEELLREAPDLVDAKDARPLPPDVRGDVALRGVSFAYGEAPVLLDVTIEARAGQVVALVGPSGGGKSTLLDLVGRFYDPDRGVVEVDGQDLRAVTRASLVEHLAIVTQEPFLFNTSVLENVRYGRPGATMEQVVEACKAAHVHDVIAALPAGYETAVGERGATLSGGQRQRVTIARALLKNPRILLLDEATSALDSESERAVQEALEVLMKGRTTLVVAHRLSTVVGADRIYVIGKASAGEGPGRVLEQGRHEELIARGGVYADLWAKQIGEG